MSIALLGLLTACQAAGSTLAGPSANPTTPDRLSALPADAAKGNPLDDPLPPISHSDSWSQPIPLPGPINTAGAEDSPFIAPDGSILFFFFTPDLQLPAEEQLLDGATGIYSSQLTQNEPSTPARVRLQEPGKLALDGCPFFDGSRLWFCSARDGFVGLHWFQALFEDGQAISWQLVEFNPDYQVGELHIFGDELYFHSDRPDGLGKRDLWLSQRQDGAWGAPENLAIVNSPEDEGYPFVTTDGRELWFTRTLEGSPAIFRSLRQGGQWSEPELIVSQFAGEPTLDPDGNLYFVHHFLQDGHLLEADIYVSYRQP
jgi:hypothetical protein